MTIYDQSARLVSEEALATTLADYATSSALAAEGRVFIAANYGVDELSEDNAPAINTLLSNVSSTGGGTILLPSGTLAIGSSIGSTDPIENVHLAGAGRRGVGGPGSGGTTLRVFANVPPISGIWNSCHISSLLLDAADLGSPAVNAHFSKCVLEDLEAIRWQGGGMRLNDGSLSDDLGYLNHLLRCSISDDSTETGPAVYIGYRWTDSWIESNNFASAETDLVIETGTTYRILGNHFNGNRHPRRNIEIRGGAIDVLVANNVFEGYRDESIVLFGNNWDSSAAVNSVTISGNIFRSDVVTGDSPIIGLYGNTVDWGGSTLDGYRMSGVSVVSNSFRTSGGSASPTHIIEARDVDDICVVGNTWRKARTDGAAPVHITDCESVEVIGNHSDNAISQD